MTANFLFLFVMLSRRLQGLPMKYLGLGLGKVLLSTLAMATWLLGLKRLLGDGGMLVDLSLLLVSIGSGALLYGLVLYALGLPELQLIVGRLREKLAGRQAG
jgi:peptidoglycan biosynthesis protein MviN/MurJ (putative lipid II flippase)